MPQDKVRDLGVILDSRLKLNMEAHVANVVRCSFYHLRQLRCIRRSLRPVYTRYTEFVANRGDYCNAMLYGTSVVVIRWSADVVIKKLTQRHRSSRCWSWQIWAHHTGSSWRPPLAVSASEDTVQNCYTDFWPRPRHRVCLLQQHCLHSRSHQAVLVSARPICSFHEPELTRLGRRSFFIVARCLELTATSPSHPVISRSQFWAGFNFKTHLFRLVFQSPTFPLRTIEEIELNWTELNIRFWAGIRNNSIWRFRFQTTDGSQKCQNQPMSVIGICEHVAHILCHKCRSGHYCECIK